MNQTHTPRSMIAVAAMDGPRPQNHAQKTTPSHAVWYGFAEPSSGVKTERRKSARAAAATASRYLNVVFPRSDDVENLSNGSHASWARHRTRHFSMRGIRSVK